MVRITEALIRKKAEHNEGIIGTLEELSLHQENVEKIENLNNWCKNLQILYLQANIISKIENLNKLKNLQYLNLALNNIEVIENLERCESLEKLDLTLNFIGNLESVASLRKNIHLKDLYLTGNPVCDFKGYREYVITKLPQLKNLDVREITKSERIKAFQNFSKAEKSVKEAQRQYEEFRQQQKERLSKANSANLSDEDFWKTTSENAPETRTEICIRAKSKQNTATKSEAQKRSVRLFTKDGRPLNINQAKVDFIFNDDDPEQYILDIAVYKYLDSNLIEVDLQPIYATVTIKGKIFQMVFPEEIFTDKSTAQRSQTTGHLVIKMPKVNYKPIKKNVKKSMPKEAGNIKREFLEVSEEHDMDFSRIINNKKQQVIKENPDVPPLEYG